MKNNGGERKTYELSWQFNPRLITSHFGKSKYSSTVKALRELVANSLDRTLLAANFLDVLRVEPKAFQSIGRGERHSMSAFHETLSTDEDRPTPR